jgi:hypothetical protein
LCKSTADSNSQRSDTLIAFLLIYPVPAHALTPQQRQDALALGLIAGAGIAIDAADTLATGSERPKAGLVPPPMARFTAERQSHQEPDDPADEKCS